MGNNIAFPRHDVSLFYLAVLYVMWVRVTNTNLQIVDQFDKVVQSFASIHNLRY